LAKILLKKLDPVNVGNTLFIYELGNFKRISYDINSPVSPAPLPEEDSEEAILIKIEGNSSAINIGWKLIDESTTRLVENNSNEDDHGGEDILLHFTGTANVKTVQEQIDFIRTYFRAKSVNDAYELVIEYDGTESTYKQKNLIFQGTFSQFHFDTADGENLTFNASCKFLEGTVATIFEQDGSSQPNNLSGTGSSGSMSLSWDAPTQSGDSSITQYAIYYKNISSGGSYTRLETGSVSTSKIIGSLPSGQYRVYVTGVTDSVGEGKESYGIYVTVT
jgi:hypothetical protein